MKDEKIMDVSIPTPRPESRLKNFPINFFTLTMGLGGFAMATQKMELMMGWTKVLSNGIVFLTSTLIALFLLIYTFKLLKYRSAVKAEWQHPVKLSFFPAISISMIILSICFFEIDRQISYWIWLSATLLQFITAFAVIRYWIKETHFKEPHLNPAWFIPAVGNILVPIVGVGHGFVELSWFFFSFGLLFWIILQVIIFNRLIFHTPLPDSLLPTLFIMIAPPSVGFISYTILTDAQTIDPLAHFLYYAGLLFFLLLATKLNVLAKLAFGLPWWAYSFPIAALTLATFRFYELTGLAYMKMLGFTLYGILSVLITLLLLNTMKAVMNRKICVSQ